MKNRKRNLPVYCGQIFGRLTAEKLHGELVNGGKAWICKCSCGNRKIIRSSALLSDNGTRSCGCLAKEASSIANTTHGHTSIIHKNGHSREYAAWNSMIGRCYRPNANGFHNYGARGITVCNRWRYSFENFFNDMGLRPSNLHSLDRIDNNGNYEPTNCRWVTKREQSLNRRTNKLILFGGRLMPLILVAEKIGMNVGRLQKRIKAGWDINIATKIGI